MDKLENEVWAIIPTRGGSKGLPEKNILPIAGKPMLHYMLSASLAAKRLTRVVLTTDSHQIAEVASGIPGVEVMRHDPVLSEPGRPSFGVFQNTLKKLLQNKGRYPKAVALLRVTTPLCEPKDIDKSIDLLFTNSKGATAVLSVVKSEVHPKRVYIVNNDGILVSREKTCEANFPLPRQQFEDVYIRNGAIYATFTKIVLQDSLWGARPVPYIMPKERSININDEIDFVLAEELLRRRAMKPVN